MERTLPGALDWPFCGVLLAPTLVLAAYGDTHVSPDHLYRPLVVAVVASAVLFVVIGMATRRWHLASFAVAVGLLAVVGLWPIAAVLALAWWILAWRAARRQEPWDLSERFTRPLNATTAAWFAIATVIAVWISLPSDLPTVEAVDVQPGPSVYLILLDAYPRADTLMDYFDFDNGPFLDALAERGFEVSEQSSSVYPLTAHVVPTMMWGRPLEDLIDGEWLGTDAEYLHMWRALNAAPIPQAYSDAGYQTYSVVSGAAALDWRTADVVLEGPWLSALEKHLLVNGALGSLLPFDAMHRASVLDTLDNIKSTAGAAPRFVLAHVMSPHDPFVFAEDGSPAQPCGFACAAHAGPANALLADRLGGQVAFLNDQLLEVVDHIIEADSEATVILFSDHGIRRDRADRDEWFRTLFAARGSSFPDDIRVLDVMRHVGPQAEN